MCPDNNFGFKQLWKKEKLTGWYYPMLFSMRLKLAAAATFATAGAFAKGGRLSTLSQGR